MKEKFLEQLKDKVKDFGISDKAIAALAEQASEGFNDDTTEEDVTKAVDFYARIAKTMQGEVTRKTQRTKDSKDSTKDSKDSTDGKDGDDDDTPAWFAKFQNKQSEAINALKAELAEMKTAKSKADRNALIASKAKEMGIPAGLIKHVTIDDDADIDETLTTLKQELVNDKLLPEKGGEQGSDDTAMAQAAEEWAKSLPDKE